jgi:hypothetical protein
MLALRANGTNLAFSNGPQARFSQLALKELELRAELSEDD